MSIRARLARLALGLALAAPVAVQHRAAAAEQVTVFAAASLKNALDEIVAGWRAETGGEARIAYAGTSALARQIEQGAPADLFISANADWMDHLVERDRVRAGSRVDLLSNRLALVAHGEDARPIEIEPGFDLAGLLGEARLAMAFVDAVPAGLYGKAALESLGVWDDVAGRVAQADNVRAALAFVARGEAPYGIVYASDALAEPGVTVVGLFPEDSHPPILHPAALVAGDETEMETAQALLDHLRSPAAGEVFRRWGFETLLD